MLLLHISYISMFVSCTINEFDLQCTKNRWVSDTGSYSAPQAQTAFRGKDRGGTEGGKSRGEGNGMGEYDR